MSSHRIQAIVTCALVVCAGTVAADWQAGMTAYSAGDYATAEREFVPYIENAPRDASYAVAYYMLGSCYTRLERPSEAEAMLRTAVELEPTAVDYVVALAQHLVGVGKYAEADEVLAEAATEALPAGEQVRLAQLQAKALLDAGDTAKAITILEQALERHAGSALLHRALGLALESSGQRQRACDELIRAFELDTTAADVGRRAAAIALDLAARSEDASASESWYRRALELSERLVEADPDPRHHTLMGEAAFGAGEFETAVPALAAASEAEPVNTRLAYLLGRSLTELGDEERALVVLTAAVERRPEDELASRIHRQVGRIHAHNLELEEAVRSFDMAGDEQTAGMIRRIDSEMGEALVTRRELLTKIDRLRDMEVELAALNDADGARAMRERTAEFQQELAALESNLDDVRKALRDL